MYTGGTITVTGTAPDWVLGSSSDLIVHILSFLLMPSDVDITKLEIVKEELASLEAII